VSVAHLCTSHLKNEINNFSKTISGNNCLHDNQGTCVLSQRERVLFVDSLGQNIFKAYAARIYSIWHIPLSIVAALCLGRFERQVCAMYVHCSALSIVDNRSYSLDEQSIIHNVRPLESNVEQMILVIVYYSVC